MPFLVLKIDVDTYRGTKEGVPNLVRLLQKHQANATFLFTLGPDHTGWALRRVFRPGFFKKVSRTSVVEHYGVKTLLYGTLLPAPDIGKTCAKELRMVKNSGFECGIHTWDHIVWQDKVRHQGSAWTLQQMEKSYTRFKSIFGHPSPTHGSAGWQMNPFAFKALDYFQFAYASDTRAMLNPDGTLTHNNSGPYRLQHNEDAYKTIQMPTTLPTLDELLGRTINEQTITPSNIAPFILNLTKTPRDHVFTLHAELEGQKLAPVLDTLLNEWKKQGYELISMEDYYRHIQHQTLPVHSIYWGELPGRSGDVLIEK